MTDPFEAIRAHLERHAGKERATFSIAGVKALLDAVDASVASVPPMTIDKRETLHDELKRLIGEYEDDDAGDSTKAEAWNLIADFAVENAKAVLTALSSQSNKCTSSDASAAVGVRVKPLITDEMVELARAEIEYSFGSSSWEFGVPRSAVRKALEAASALSTVEAPQPQAGEAEAWRWRLPTDTKWQFTDGPEKPRLGLPNSFEAAAIKEPVYAAPVPPQAVPAEGIAEHLLRLAKVGFGYDIKPEDRTILREAARALTTNGGAK